MKKIDVNSSTFVKKILHVYEDMEEIALQLILAQKHN